MPIYTNLAFIRGAVIHEPRIIDFTKKDGESTRMMTLSVASSYCVKKGGKWENANNYPQLTIYNSKLIDLVLKQLSPKKGDSPKQAFFKGYITNKPVTTVGKDGKQYTIQTNVVVVTEIELLSTGADPGYSRNDYPEDDGTSGIPYDDRDEF